MGKSKREKILNAALEMFVEKGFEGSPTSKIAKNAGVATGTLFHYFKTKDELINELYLEIKSHLINSILSNIDNNTTIRQQLEATWLGTIRWGISNSTASNFLAMFNASPYITKLTREKGCQRFLFLMELLQSGQEQDILKDVSLEVLLQTTYGIVINASSYFQKYPEEFENDEIKQKVFQILWDSIKR